MQANKEALIQSLILISFSYLIKLTAIYLSSIVIFIIDTLIPAHLEEFGKIGLRYAQVYVINHEELRVVFHIVGVR